MSLKDLEIQDEYRDDSCDLIQEFYVPCLERATVYSRSVGFFSSTSLVAAARGLTALIRSGGKMRLVASPRLSVEDADAIAQGLRQQEEAITNAVLRELDREFEQVVRNRLACLAWLLGHGLLEIKLAVVTDIYKKGIYHEKLGIFADDEGNIIAFTGSANESSSALIENFECIDVFWSWDAANMRRRALRKAEHFQRLWNNDTPKIQVMGFPEAAARSLLRLQPTQTPEWEPTLNTDERVWIFSQSGRSNNTDKNETRQSEVEVLANPSVTTFLKVELRPRQVDALRDWKAADYHGILAMATGTGKTITGLGCAASIDYLDIVVIGAPTNEIVQQWVNEIEKRTNFQTPLVATGNAENWMEPLFRKLRLIHGRQLSHERLPVVVVGSYGELSKARMAELIIDAGGLPEQSLLIADEVHATGATNYRRLLRDDFRYRLGLSATPLRPNDEEGTDFVLKYFGGIVYKFTLEQAIAAGILCEYEYYVYLAELTEDEYAEFKELTVKIGRLFDSDQAEQAKFLMIQRANILKSAASKLASLERIINNHPPMKGMIYCANIEQATDASRLLTHRGFRVARYSSDDVDRKRLLSEFAHGRLDALVAVKCLDEGVDIPEANLAIILASDASERQFIQRRGRVLRAAVGKSLARIVDVLVVPPASDDSAKILESELSRLIQFARAAKNRMSVIMALVHELAPYGVTHSDFL